MKIDHWFSMYPSQWKGKICPESAQHPAKFSSRLIKAIYDHICDEGWVKPGDVVVDPFGGVALGAMDAMLHGLSWMGVELELRFVKMGNDNIALWNKRFSSMPLWSGEAVLLQGDSRNLAKIISSFNQVVSSPPYADDSQHTGGNDKHPERMEGGAFFGVGINGVVSSPPYADSDQNYKEGWERFHDGREPLHKNDIQREAQYGESAGQLGAMKSTEKGFQASISSPPFAESTADGGWQMLGKYAEEGKLTVKQVKGKKDKAYPSWSKDRDTDYAPSPENLGNAKANDESFQASVSSPPFQGNTGGTNVTAKSGVLADERLLNRHAAGNSAAGYGESEGNLGSELGNDFWLSARTIVEQVYQVLEPGGHAVWIVKDYVKAKERVPFCDQWRQLCEAVGFVTLHEHHAMLVKDKGTSITLEGENIHHQTSSKSFFRRLAEKKGSPHIDFETIFCMEKPA